MPPTVTTMPPLNGLRVIDLTRVVAGPYCTMMLGDMGAEVLKIEEPEHGDDSRGWGPYINGWSSFFLELNRSKKSVTLDLKKNEGAQALRRLIETADVLIENFRPGSLAELGFDYASVSSINPRLIYCSISGYGQTGPHAHLPGFVAVANPRLWGRFCEAIGRPELRDDPRFATNTDRVTSRQLLKQELEAVFARLTVGELTTRLQAQNVPCGRVRSMREALEHPQVKARDTLLTQQRPELTVETLAPVVKLSRTPADVRLPPPALGEHTKEILEQL